MILPLRVSVARLTKGADTKQESYVTILTGVRMDIQPARGELVAVSEGVYGTTFQAFCAISGLMVGDQITVSGSNANYIVRAVNSWRSGMPHSELVLFQGDN